LSLLNIAKKKAAIDQSINAISPWVLQRLQMQNLSVDW
jgi:hypothetical protein